jgi:ceramide glucosyltransferase
MIRAAIEITKVIAVFLTVSSMGYYAFCIVCAFRFLRERKNADKSVGATQAYPPVSICKPLKGTDPEMYENFRSHCLQDYPEYEIIFGVSDPDDPAIQLVEQLKREFPERSIRLVVCHESVGPNTKVSNLVQMAQRAKCSLFVVNDSDIRVDRDYLRRVLAPLQQESIGLVTCLYRAIANSTLTSCIESLGIVDFSAAVLSSHRVEGGLRFGLGSTLAFRRRELEAIGGFEALVNYLADDYQLGQRIFERQLAVKLSDVIVETVLPAYTLREFVAHQLRWARTVRTSRPRGYSGFVITFGLFWGLLALFFSSGATWAWQLLLAVLLLRTGMMLLVGRGVLLDRQIHKLIWLLPLRDLIAPLFWFASFLGNTVAWRGDRFVVSKGKLAKVSG